MENKISSSEKANNELITGIANNIILLMRMGVPGRFKSSLEDLLWGSLHDKLKENENN